MAISSDVFRNCRVDGRPIAAGQVRRRAHNFTQHWRSPDAVAVGWSAEFDRDQVVRWALEGAEFLIESAEDPDDALELEMDIHRMLPIDAATLTADDRMLARVAVWDRGMQLLDSASSGESCQLPGYLINSVRVTRIAQGIVDLRALPTWRAWLASARRSSPMRTIKGAIGQLERARNRCAGAMSPRPGRPRSASGIVRRRFGSLPGRRSPDR